MHQEEAQDVLSFFDKPRLSCNTQTKKIVKIPTNCFKRKEDAQLAQPLVKSEEMGIVITTERVSRIMVFRSVLSKH